MNEAETRAELIDPALKAAGWGAVEGSRIRREYLIAPGRIEGGGKRGKPMAADYVLEYKNTKLAVIEAKARDKALTEGVAQAKNYSGKLQVRYACAKNGLGINRIDMHTGAEGEIPCYPTPDELWALTFPPDDSTAETWHERFAAIPFEDKGGSHPGRYYQDIAVERVLKAVAENDDRILLTLATGTGKTFIAFQIAWKLFHARWNITRQPTRRPRILFLADRNILANQAYNAFSAFPEDALVRIEPDEIAKKKKVPKNGSLFFTIFQTFIASAGSATDYSTDYSTDCSSDCITVEPPKSSAGLVELPATEPEEVREIENAYAYGFMYILHCADGSLYTGSTTNLRLRLEQHRTGEGAKHTGARLPVRLVHYETFDRIDEAFAREKQIQGWSRAKKLALIKGDLESLRQLSRRKPVPEPVEGYFGEYPADFFDFIIIDECHRGGANDESTWREILNYFSPAVQLGLTATPKRRDNVDTYAYFGEPVFTYSLKDGINDGYLTPFRVKQISTTLDDYTYTSDDRVMEGEVVPGKLYTESEFNRKIVIDEREKKRVEIFMSQIDQRQKTLVFCATQGHALAVRDYINQIKTSKDPNYCHRVTADDGALGEQHLRDFQDNEKSIPTILTTSQKLSTGVDARNIRNIVLMRPVNSMIEFKQIIGRGTRLYDGKDYFTIYDFVKAHQHFHDEEWDGPPSEPEPCKKCGQYPCVCTTPEPEPCAVCGERPCVCPCAECGKRPCECERKKKTKVKLADGKERNIQHMMMTTFWHPDGTPMSAQQFIELLFGKLPEFFKDEEELRALWSQPDTRKKLLDGLAEKGFGKDQLAEMQRIIDAEKSDLFDVLAHVAYALPPLTRDDRAAKAKVEISTHFNSKQQVFLDFVLSHYVTQGVEELGQEKLTPLLRLKYHNSIADAVADLGTDVGEAFASFQKFLYQEVA